ncbi:SDR family oxidoreductase [Pseudoalteromonas umbrosa]|uniref:SDR family oxidoreductase n=1 Tax=Pseudoalteromonas umbrosa TaxID=3048489 RepID=UPI0024C4152E|nr:SDR family oxidoreductase [Pseudoalteromonas sp. B95]MDK1290627.1 SDR family oxidoreductase [Pseudoalteromonas sp. B95]
MDFGIRNKRALVFGASRGLGRATALQLAQEGCDLVLVARTQASLKQLADSLSETYGICCQWLALDTTDKHALHHLLDYLDDAELHIDILVNISGGPSIGSALNTPSTEFTMAFDAMVGFFIELSRILGQRMVNAQWGRIVTVTSSGVIKPIPELVISNTLRSALTNWMNTFAQELAASGVTVNCIVPGRIHTERVNEIDAMRATKQGITIAQQAERSQASIPMKRYGTEREFAATVAFLVSEPAGYITASSVRVDGGLVNRYD